MRSDNLLYAAGKHLAKMQFINGRVAKVFVIICSADFCRNITWEIVGWLLRNIFLYKMWHKRARYSGANSQILKDHFTFVVKVKKV